MSLLESTKKALKVFVTPRGRAVAMIIKNGESETVDLAWACRRTDKPVSTSSLVPNLIRILREAFEQLGERIDHSTDRAVYIWQVNVDQSSSVHLEPADRDDMLVLNKHGYGISWAVGDGSRRRRSW